MKCFFVLSITLLFALVAGCDGDGDGTTADADTPIEPVDSSPTTITLCSGTATIGEGYTEKGLCYFSIYETGTLEGRVEWSGQPDTLVIAIMPGHIQGPPGSGQSSPAVTTLEMTESYLGVSNDWHLRAMNESGPEVEVDYIVRFTPD
jgi:hypothetical protein